MVNPERLKTADKITGKIKEVLKPLEINELAKKQEIPHYLLVNPLTKEEIFCFVQDEVNEWFKSYIRQIPVKTPPVINFMRYKQQCITETDIIPSSLSLIRDLKKIPLSFFETPPGVYFLCKDDEIVYIGQARNVSSRVMSHFKEKEFDSIFYINCHISQLCPLEKALIRYYKPALNDHMTQKEIDDMDKQILSGVWWKGEQSENDVTQEADNQT
jgi:hypothetical protein